MTSAFQIQKDGKILNYRDGEKLDEISLREFFEARGYAIVSYVQQARHIILHLIKESKQFCAKVSCSAGISVLTAREIEWNKKVLRTLPENAVFTVPQVVEEGTYAKEYVYYVTQWRSSQLLAACPPAHTAVPPFSFPADIIKKIVLMTQHIQQLPVDLSIPDERALAYSHTDIFVEKTHQWKEQVPTAIPAYSLLEELNAVAKGGALSLEQVVRHGDVAPWHIQELPNGKLLLFDGEHAHSQGVEGYDISYFIQRVYSVLLNPKLAIEFFDLATTTGYEREKLKTVLAARAIGGFCDESLLPESDYAIHVNFAQWVLSL